MPRVLTKREYVKRRIRFQVAAGLFDFIGSILCFFMILFCVYMLSSLFNWVSSDVPTTFKAFFDIADKAFTTH